MSYYNHIWNKVLGSGEKVEMSFTLSYRYLYFQLSFWLSLSFAALLLTAFFGIYAFAAAVMIFLASFFYYGFYMRWANAYALTNRRMLIHYGWLSTRMTSVDYSQITDVHATESFLDKILFNMGTLSINTAGSDGHEVKLTRISHPYKIKQRLTDLMEADEWAHK